ncbi:MAG TPA: TonB-dependent receptor, partial [Vicinamibacterales bacterium]|nr:TonB-dependent receptor [Vicinamibacterales bacterium]
MQERVLGALRLSAGLAVVVYVLVWSTAAFAQAASGAATLSGKVLDPESKVVVNAAVIVRNEATNDIRTTSTDAVGHFSMTGLAPGLYTIEVAVPGFEIVRRAGVRAQEGLAEDVAINLTVANISETVTVSTALPTAAVAAPSQGSLTARSAESLISAEYIRNYTSPFSDYSQVLQMAPGTFSVSANGPGLSDTKTFYRGFQDGQYSMTFDGIPFNDTNDPTHHSWVFFPAQTIGSTVFDRSPGSAASIGPSTYGGSVNMLSRSLPAEMQVNGTVSYGSFNTRLFDGEFDSGKFGSDGNQRLLIEGHQMLSDGYQTYNYQDRKAFSAKYQYTVSDKTQITAFSSVMQLNANTPNQKGSTRAQIAQFGDNFLMTNDPQSPLYYKYNFYSIPTNFEYVGVKTDLGGGWTIDDKVYTMRYYNKQNYNGTTSITTTSATDKLNSYWKVGNNVPISKT